MFPGHNGTPRLQSQPVNLDYLLFRKLRHAAHLSSERPVHRHLRNPLKLAVVDADFAQARRQADRAQEGFQVTDAFFNRGLIRNM